MAEATFDDFMKRYNPDGTHPVTEIEAPAGAPRNTSPFIVVRSGRWTAIVNPLAFEKYLDLDVHSFADGEDATAGVFAMSEGRRYPTLRDTGTTSAGWPSARLVAVLIGNQGTSR
jgi:hypothetical protein